MIAQDIRAIAPAGIHFAFAQPHRLLHVDLAGKVGQRAHADKRRAHAGQSALIQLWIVSNSHEAETKSKIASPKNSKRSLSAKASSSGFSLANDECVSARCKSSGLLKEGNIF